MNIPLKLRSAATGIKLRRIIDLFTVPLHSRGSNLVSSRRRHAKPSVDFAGYVKITRNDPDIENSSKFKRKKLNLVPFQLATFIKFLFAAFFLSTSLVAQSQPPHHPQPSRITPEAWRAARQEIRSASLEEKIDYLLDRAEIEDIITTYAYSVDTRNWPLHGEIFKESFKQRRGDDYREVDNHNRLKSLDKFFQRFTSKQHLGFPLAIMIEGDTAYATASLHARHYDKSGDPLDNTLLFGQYEFWFERTSKGWKVNKLAQVNRTRINTSEANFSEETSP